MKNKFLHLFTIALFVMAFLPVQEAISQTVLINPASPWTVPAGVTQIKVEVWGGGGSGGGVNSVLGTAFGSGGGGGAYSTNVLSVSGGQSYTITVGAGGPTGANDVNGTAGTASSVSGPGGTVTANPGAGGARRGGAAGAGGTGTFNGGAGGLATSQGAGGGGGGGNAGAGSAGTNAAAGNGGIGNPNVAPNVGGIGGGIRGGTGGNHGLPGTAPGGGGGGGYSILLSGAKTGGAGGAGQVVITYCPTYSLTSISAVTPRCESTPTSTITLNGNLPVGSYTVTYNRSAPAATGLTASMTVTTANTGTFIAAGLTTVGNTTVTVTNIGSTTATFCTNNISSNNSTVVGIDGAATVGAGSDQTVCTAVDVTLAGSFGGTASSATWTGGTGIFNPNNTTINAVYSPSPAEITAGTATLTLTTDNPAGACNAVSDAMIIAIKKAPTAINITPASSTICIGGNVPLAATATINSTATLSTDNFNGTVSYAASGTNSGGGTIFSQQSSGYSVNLNAINNNDASKFMIATTAAGLGNASTNSTLTSPVINTTAYSALTFSFRHFYTKGSEAGVSVQVSTNGGGAWSNVSTAGAIIGTNTYTASTGASGTFAVASFNLTPFINQANFMIRFNFVSNVGILGSSWWAIDDPLLNGTPLPVFSWTASTGAGINGLPGGSGSLTIANKNITVTPTATTTYTLTASDVVTGCGLSTATATVNVNQNSTMSFSSPAGTNAQTICMPGSISDITYAIGGGGTGASITAGILPTGLTASYNAGQFKISGTPTQFGNFSYTVTTTGPCVNVSLSGTLTVNTAPGLTCPANQVTTTDPGVCLASRAYDLAVATGFPAPAVSYLVDGNFINFPYDFPLGTTTVQVLAEGACAPNADCSFTVTVNDEEGPTPDLASLPDATGECSVTVTDVPTATDACDGAFNGTTTDPLTYSTQGTFTIHWTYTDLKGNTTAQEQTVIVDDITAPVANVASLPDATGECSVTVSAPTATDNCVGLVTGTTTNPLIYNTQGTFTVNWTYNDGNGNFSTQTQTVIVDDITAPVANVAGLPDATGECSVTVNSPTATDNCVGLVTGTTTDPLTYNTQGTFTVNWNYNDGNGNTSSQTQTVIVHDMTAPVANIASLPVVTGECSVTVSAPTATDNCVGLVTGTTTDPLTYNTQGSFTIHWTYDDGNGNTSSQTQTVIVDDITAPVPDIATLPVVTGECAATVSTAPTATDNCVGSITATTTDPLTYNTQGTFTIHWTYDDGNGNISSQTQSVIVDDITAPVPNVATLPNVSGECSATVSSTPSATDNCTGSVTATTTDPLTYSTQGTFTIHWTYNDGNGNSSTQIQTVIVNDVTAPSITCPPAQTFCSVPGNNFTIPAAIASDNCTVVSVTYNITGSTTRTGSGTNASGLFNPGASTITWTVTDANNNTNTCSSTVNIQVPLLVPTVTGVQNVCPYLGTGDQLTYTAFAFGATSYTWILPPNVNVISGLGTNSITLTFNNAFSSQNNKQLRFTASNTCGTSPLGVYYLLTQFPSTPNPITGTTNVCSLIGTTNTTSYSISPVTAATGYAWSIPAGIDTTHPNPSGGINDTIINVKFNGSFAGGNISVTATNGCGVSGTRSISIPRTPSSTPGLISGPTNACANILPGGTAATYSVVPVNGATSYTWVTPAGSVITHPNGTGANDYTITVQFATGFTSGTISVSSTNGCGTSGLRSLSITRLNPATPSVADVIQVGFCGDPGGRVYTYTLSAMPANATSVQWTVPTAQGALLVSGQGSTSITVSYPSTAVQGSVTAQSFNNCGSSTIRSSTVKLPACPSGFSKGSENNADKDGHALPVDIKAFEAQIYPNPSISDFRLKVMTPDNEKINIRILDMQGRELKTVLVMPYETINIGADLKTGSYLVEIKQGKNTTIKKIQKF